MTNVVESPLLTYEEVARRFGVCVRTVKRLVDKKKLRVVDIGYRTQRFRPADVARCEAKLSGGDEPL